MTRSLLFALLLALAGTTIHAQAQSLANAPVAALDLQRYAGQWHEIAHLPMFFQRHCVANITAEYELLADGTVAVRNACDDGQGKRLAAEGIARKAGGPEGQLEVRFAPGWLSWVPMTWADYWVVDLDPDYRWALVGGPSRKYLWVIAREPSLSRAQFDALRARAAQRGYPVDKLVLPRGTVR